MITENREAAIERLRVWREKPTQFVKDVCGATPDDWQGDVLDAYPTHSRIAMKACVGPGKTAVLAWAPLNYIVTRPLPKIAATSISWPNLRDNLWAELAKWIAQSEFLNSILDWSQTRISLKENPKESWITARTWDRAADEDTQAKTLSGLHADYIMAIGDETGGMPVAVMQTAEQILSSCVEGHVLQAGNPTHLAGALHQATMKSQGSYHVVEVTGDPDDPRRSPRVDLEWAKEMIEIWGRDSSYVRSKILGKFPRQATDALVGLDHFEDAFERTVSVGGSTLSNGVRALGVDVARLGDDMTVYIERDGDFYVGYDMWSGKRTDYTVDRLARVIRERDIQIVNVDDIGVGGGVTDGLKRERREGRLPRSVRIRGVNVGRASEKLDRSGNKLFRNLKAELNSALAEKFRRGEISLAPAFRKSTLVEEGTDVRYDFARGSNTLVIEDKDDYRKRHGGKSPDLWDALVLASAARAIKSDLQFGWVA